MLLGHVVLRDAARRVAADVWLARERTEHEAAAVFSRLADDLEASDAPSALVALARRCSADETEHAIHCRRIVDAIEPGLPARAPDHGVQLGWSEMEPAERALYASVALGCVTETLSTALLIEMRAGAPVGGVVRAGLDAILRDEVRHSRLGWAHLALSASRRDVSWLSCHVAAMLAETLAPETTEDRGVLSHDDRAALLAWGILPAAAVARVCESTVRTAIGPGLRRFGVEARLGV